MANLGNDFILSMFIFMSGLIKNDFSFCRNGFFSRKTSIKTSSRGDVTAKKFSYSHSKDLQKNLVIVLLVLSFGDLCSAVLPVEKASSTLH